ncbi:MAG TPA: 4-hydroxy-tetrahydrodipicolinate synthase [Bacteroidales bacterium]|nr:4-hydroxy-tetrahydrodipicolinate synthase [Bacteroidales bacterium]
MDKNFKGTGTGVAIVTPFHKQRNINFTSLGNIVEHVINGGVDYIVCLGTTAEVPTLTAQEQMAVLDCMIDQVDKRVPIVLGMGGNNTSDLVDRIAKTDLSEVSAILSVTPYYNKPSQKGIYEHFKAVAEASSVPVILYNVPGRTSSNISAETCLQLANDFPNIIGIKEASGNFSQCMEIIAKKPKNFQVISGEDALTLPLMSAGITGIISVTANAFPKEVSTMINFGLKGDFKKAKDIHYKLLSFTNAIFEEGNPAGIKAALEIMQISQCYLRLPLVKVSKPLYNKIENLINEISK